MTALAIPIAVLRRVATAVLARVLAARRRRRQGLETRTVDHFAALRAAAVRPLRNASERRAHRAQLDLQTLLNAPCGFVLFFLNGVVIRGSPHLLNHRMIIVTPRIFPRNVTQLAFQPCPLFIELPFMGREEFRIERCARRHHHTIKYTGLSANLKAPQSGLI